MAEQGGGGGLIFGLIIGYFIWGNEPAYIDELKSSAETGSGPVYALMKNTFGPEQVVLVHGFVDDQDVCLKIRRMLMSEGGNYSCQPAENVTGGKPWWEFW